MEFIFSIIKNPILVAHNLYDKLYVDYLNRRLGKSIISEFYKDFSSLFSKPKLSQSAIIQQVCWKSLPLNLDLLCILNTLFSLERISPRQMAGQTIQKKYLSRRRTKISTVKVTSCFRALVWRLQHLSWLTPVKMVAHSIFLSPAETFTSGILLKGLLGGFKTRTLTKYYNRW